MPQEPDGVARVSREMNGETREVVRVTFGGRTIEAISLDMAEQWDFMEVAGSQIDNPAWVNTALLAASVISIDGVPEPAGAKGRDALRKILKKIGETGLDALHHAFDAPEAAATASASADAVRVAAGNW